MRGTAKPLFENDSEAFFENESEALFEGHSERDRRPWTFEMLFQGEFPQSLDSKNRVVLPAAFRKELPEDEARRVVVTIGRRAQWLNLYTRAAWLERVARLEEKYDEDDEDDEKFLRDVYASANDIDLDAQFRFILPKERRDRVGIDRELVFVGMGKRVEIWAQDRYEAYRAGREGKEASPNVKT